MDYRITIYITKKTCQSLEKKRVVLLFSRYSLDRELQFLYTSIMSEKHISKIKEQITSNLNLVQDLLFIYGDFKYK